MKFLAALIIFHSNDGGHYVAKKTDRARVKLTAIRRLHADLAMIVRRGCQHELHGFELIVTALARGLWIITLCQLSNRNNTGRSLKRRKATIE